MPGRAHAHPDRERAGCDRRARSSPRQPDPILLPRCSRVVLAQVAVIAAEYLAAQADRVSSSPWFGVDLDGDDIGPIRAWADRGETAGANPIAREAGTRSLTRPLRPARSAMTDAIVDRLSPSSWVRSARASSPAADGCVPARSPGSCAVRFGSNDVGQAHLLTAVRTRRAGYLTPVRSAPAGATGRRRPPRRAARRRVIIRLYRGPRLGFQAQPVRDDRDDQTADNRASRM